MNRSSTNLLLAVVAAGAALLLASSASAAKPADTVLKNGTVLTMDAKAPVKGAVAISSGRIVFTGSSKSVGKFINKGTRVINLKGKTAMPGLIDGHSHPLGGGDILDDCDLGNVGASIDDLLAMISDCDKADPATGPNDWLQVSNWSPVGVLPAGTIVTRQDLDRVSTRPIYVQGSDFHNAWVNSKALELAGITKDTPDPGDGAFVREPDGTPSGLVKDSAQFIVSGAIPPKKFSEMLADGRRAVRAFNATGITTTTDAASDESSLKVWKALASKHQMTLGMNSFELIDSSFSVDDAAGYYKSLAKKYSKGTLRVPGIKLLLDGVIEYPSQTAGLLKPYLT